VAEGAFTCLFPMRGKDHMAHRRHCPGKRLRDRRDLDIEVVLPSLRRRGREPALSIKTCMCVSTYRIHHRCRASRLRAAVLFMLGDVGAHHTPGRRAGHETPAC
jgi:hypothetical protein